jgi:hypothetical protein
VHPGNYELKNEGKIIVSSVQERNGIKKYNYYDALRKKMMENT